jgi:hypothetical protein
MTNPNTMTTAQDKLFAEIMGDVETAKAITSAAFDAIDAQEQADEMN